MRERDMTDELTPYEKVSEAAHQICAILGRGNLNYEMAPELFHALSLLDSVLKGFDGAMAMVERAETEASLH